MVKSSDIPAVSAFTEEFARLLRAVVDDLGVSRQAIADEIGRSRAFVSDQLLGKRPVDTDVMSGIAAVIGVPVRLIVRQIMDQMPPDLVGIPGLNPAAELDARRALGKPRSRLPQGPPVPQIVVDEKPVSELGSSLSDLYDEASAAEPERRDVEGDEEPELP